MVSMAFGGFPAEGFAFLEDLHANNNKEWFNANKKRYIEHVRTPAIDLVAALGSRLQEKFPDVQFDTRANGSGSLMRINRDIRFSPDKRPYKTNIAMMFWQGAGKKTQNPAFGLKISIAEESGVMAGMFGMDKHQLSAYRDAVIHDKQGWALVDAVKKVQAAGAAYTINGQHYKKGPRGFTIPDDERGQYLLFNALWGSASIVERDVITSAAYIDVCMEHFVALAPIQQWLVSVLP